MASSSIFQRRLIPKSLIIHNYSLVVKSLLSSSSCPLDFPEKPSSSATLCFERRRMQSVLDTSWSSSQLLPSQVSPWLMLPPELTFKEAEDEGEGGDEADEDEDVDENDTTATSDDDDDEDEEEQGDDDDEYEDDEDKDRDNYNAAVVKNVVYKFYSLRDNKVISFQGDDGGEHLQLHNHRAGGSDEFKGSSHGWLALFDSSPPNDLFLYNPISCRRLKLPTMDTLPLRGRPRKKGPIDLLSSPERSIVKKVILSSSDPEKDECCVAMMLYGADNRLAFCHPARGAQAKWYPLVSDHWAWSKDLCERSARSYEDVAYSAREKLFFCLTKDELEAWDSLDLLAEDMPISIKDYFSSPNNNKSEHYPWPRRCEREFYLKSLCNKYRERYLVVAEPAHDGGGGGLPSQQLFLVQRHKMRLLDGVYCYDDDLEDTNYICPLQTVAFDVHRFDVEKRELVYMDRTLDGLAFFVGKNHSFAVRAGERTTLKPDSIYFTDAEPQDDPKLSRIVNDLFGGHDNGVYHYKDGTFSSCYYPCEAASYKRMVPAPMWFSPLHYKPT